MKDVKRMYLISHFDTKFRRKWRGHKIEQRWFFVTKGSYEIHVVKINDFEKPDQNLEIKTYILSVNDPHVLHVPKGHATSLRALESDATVMVFADTSIEDAKHDDQQYNADYFNNLK
nr:WxcM-like domain-containing protein [Pedobacter sp. MC2016-24]